MAYCSQVPSKPMAYASGIGTRLLTMIQVSDREHFELKVPGLALCLWK